MISPGFLSARIDTMPKRRTTRKSTPPDDRAAASTAAVRGFWIGGIFLPLLITLVIAGLSVWQYRTLVDLRDHGLHTVGVVVGKHSGHGKRRDYFLRVKLDVDGRTVRRDIDAPLYIWDTSDRGSAVNITYLRDLSAMQIGDVTDEQLYDILVPRLAIFGFVAIIWLWFLSKIYPDYRRAKRYLSELPKPQ